MGCYFMFDIISGLFGYLGSDVNTLSKKKMFLISLLFGLLIFLTICIEEFFRNASIDLIIFAIFLSLFTAAFMFFCFIISDLVKKKSKS